MLGSLTLARLATRFDLQGLALRADAEVQATAPSSRGSASEMPR